MMQTEASRLTREDKRELERRIKILEGEIEIYNQRATETTDWEEKEGLEVQIIWMTKELRRLRRLRI